MPVKIENNYGSISKPRFVTTSYKDEVMRTWNLDHIVYIRDGVWMGEETFHRYEVVLSNGTVEQISKGEYADLMLATQKERTQL